MLRDVTFLNNRAANGGGFWNDSDNVTLEGVGFIANHAILGGGLYNMNADTRITNTVFLGNEARNGGAGLVNEKSNPLLTNVVFSGNRVIEDVGGGGAMLNYESSPVLINTVFSQNQAVGNGGALWNEYKSHPTIINSILWGNTAAAGAQFFNRSGACCPDGPSSATVSHSLVEGALPEGVTDAGGTLDLDPLFVDADGADDVPGTEDDDLRVQMGSPAIDAGNTDALPPDSLDLDSDGDIAEPLPVDLSYNQRVFDGGSGAAIVDMGAYEFGAPPVWVAVEPSSPEVTELPVRWTLYPNPFRDQTTLAFSLRRSGPVQVLLYDVLGRQVERLYEGVSVGGPMHTLRIDGKGLPAGVYVVRLLGEGLDATRTILLLR